MKKIATIDVSNVSCAVIYFLYYKGELVYIGESSRGLQRVFEHTNKQFDRVELFSAPSDQIERSALEEELIEKHRPMYNKSIWESSRNKKEGYVSLDKVRVLLKKLGHYYVTGSLRNLVKKEGEYRLNGSRFWVQKENICGLLSNKYGLDISVYRDKIS